MTKSMFKAFDNEDGYVTVICLRDRYIEDLEKMGFVDNADKLGDLSATKAPKPVEPINSKVMEPVNKSKKTKKGK